MYMSNRDLAAIRIAANNVGDYTVVKIVNEIFNTSQIRSRHIRIARKTELIAQLRNMLAAEDSCIE
jgi:hypothetical protein